MSKSKLSGPQAGNDFHKSNGGDWSTGFEGPSLTRQEFAEECDINILMSRTNTFVHGGPNGLGSREPMYMDFADHPQDLLGYLTFIKDAEDQFMRLDASIRKEFDNSAVEFVAFASDPGNLDQMREWGLAPPAKVPEAPAVVAPSPAPAPPEKAPEPSGGASTHGST